MHKHNVLPIFFFFAVSSPSVQAGNLKEAIRYRVRSGYDGNMLTSQYPTYATDLTLSLGDVTTEEWQQGPNQLWVLHNRPNNGSAISNGTENEDLYWMKPVRGVLNSLTGIPGEKEVILEIREITENSGTFTIRNAANKLCLENQGLGLETVYRECNEFNTAQQWDFEDPRNLKFHIRLLDQLFGIFH
ncbi:uncharacterized protein LOC110852295 [Folsomia candida]|uniref:uncharacterized protein LOC110852295 n=1 Tax=Folsomia candida TaxID=158441 RepID=UPI000B904B55|nr:uncharacterized protein LOC110852295 [Folsomia candida]